MKQISIASWGLALVIAVSGINGVRDANARVQDPLVKARAVGVDALTEDHLAFLRWPRRDEAAEKITALEVAREQAEQDPRATTALRAALAAMLIEARLAAGLDAEAIDVYRALDDDVAQRLLHGVGVERLDEKAELSFRPRWIGADIAIALAAGGRRSEALALLDSLDAYDASQENPDRADWPETLRDKLAPDCVEELLRDDAAFDAFGWRFGEDGEARCPGASTARSFVRLADTRITKGGLPKRWSVSITPNFSPHAREASRERELKRLLSSHPDWAKRIASLKPKLEAADRRDASLIVRDRNFSRTQFNEDPSGQPSSQDVALATAIRARLHSHRYDPFRIDVVEGKAAARDDTFGACGARAPLKIASSGSTRWALVATGRVDPSGELPICGFWLTQERESDGAKTFYLGIREHDPFSLEVDNTLPLVDGGTVRLPMVVRELARNSITFPPIRLAFRESGQRVLLSASIDDIVRDTDGDGLTDLLEDRLLLDRESADSDGDGLNDRVDRLPNIASAADSSNAAAAMTAFFDLMKPKAGAAQSSDKSSAIEATLFIKADAASMRGITPEFRTIVIPLSLSPAELEKRAGFSPFFMRQVRLKLDSGERTGVIIWNDRWRGGTVAVFFDGTRWRAGSLEMWIT